MPNKEEVLNTCLLEHCAPPVKNLDLKLDSLPIDRALWIHWDVAQADTFNLVVCDKPQPETRKGILSSLATIYDPLCLDCPLVPGRDINKELCGMKYTWNDQLPDESVVKWKNWKSRVTSLTGYSMPRSLTPHSSRLWSRNSRAKSLRRRSWRAWIRNSILPVLCWVRRKHPQ